MSLCFIPDLLGKSLQVLSSSSVLLQKLRQLQRVEALQRRGAVLQDEDAEEEVKCTRQVSLFISCLLHMNQDLLFISVVTFPATSSQSSQCGGAVALRLEELVEMLQDRRRRADQAVRLQLQQAENGIMVRNKEQESRCDVRVREVCEHQRLKVPHCVGQ